MGTMGTWRGVGGEAISSQLPSEAPHDKPLPREEGLVKDWGLVAEGEVVYHLGLYGKVEGAPLEGQHGAVVISCALRKNPDPHLGKKESRKTHTYAEVRKWFSAVMGLLRPTGSAY